MKIPAVVLMIGMIMAVAPARADMAKEFITATLPKEQLLDLAKENQQAIMLVGAARRKALAEGFGPDSHAAMFEKNSKASWKNVVEKFDAIRSAAGGGNPVLNVDPDTRIDTIYAESSSLILLLGK